MKTNALSFNEKTIYEGIGDSTILDIYLDLSIVYKAVYARITGTVNTGLLLSQLCYWYKTMKYAEFYKTNEDMRYELGMGLNEFKAAKKKLCDLDLITVTIRGTPAKSYYKVNLKALKAALSSWHRISHHAGLKSTSQLVEIQPTTTEITTEITTDSGSARAKRLPPPPLRKEISKDLSQEQTAIPFPVEGTLSSTWEQVALTAGIHKDYLQEVFTVFKNYWTEREGARKKDWQKTWQSWCLQEVGSRRFIYPKPEEHKKTSYGSNDTPEEKVQKVQGIEEVIQASTDDDSVKRLRLSLLKEFGREIYQGWFGGTNIQQKDNSLVFGLGTTFKKDYVQTHYLSKIYEIMKKISFGCSMILLE